MTANTDPFATLLVRDTSSVRKAMMALSANGREVVLVHDCAGRLVGLITDGDIRRGLLAGVTLESSVSEVMRRDFFAVSPGADRAFILDHMKARTIQHVPVLDKERRLVAIHFLRDLIGGRPKPNSAVIMAGGKGTRLRPVTESIPKPMVEVAGRPILERIVLHLVGHGVHKIFLSVNYKAHIIEDYFGDGAAFGCHIAYLRETEPRGTGGSLALLPAQPADPILVLNGDQLTQVDLTTMLEVHVKNAWTATVGIGPYQVQVPFGTVRERNGRLLAFEEKPTINMLVNRGIYVLDPVVLDYVPKDQDFAITSLFETLLQRRKHIGVFYFDDYWLDIGRLPDLRRANGVS